MELNGFELKIIHVDWNAKTKPKISDDLQSFVETVTVSAIAVELCPSDTLKGVWDARVSTFPKIDGVSAQLAVETSDPEAEVFYKSNGSYCPLSHIEFEGRHYFIARGKWREVESSGKTSYYPEDLTVMTAGEIKLKIKTCSTTFCRVRVVPTVITEEDYNLLRRDFRGTLSRLLAREDSPVSTSHPLWNDAPSDHLLEFIDVFCGAVTRLLPYLKQILKGAIEELPTSRVRVCSQTVRDLARHPSVRTVSSRTSVASLDTMENRYVSWMVGHVTRLVISCRDIYKDRITEYKFAMEGLTQSEKQVQDEILALGPKKPSRRTELEDQVSAIQQDLKLYRELEINRTALMARCESLNEVLGNLQGHLKAKSITPSNSVPSSVIFLQNTKYRRAYLSYREVLRLSGLRDDHHDLHSGDGELQILQLSKLYERWCLLCLMTTLLDDFRFVISDAKQGEPWRERLVTAILDPVQEKKSEKGKPKEDKPPPPTFACTLIREDARRKIELSYEPTWWRPKNEAKLDWHGKKPDFELRIFTHSSEVDSVWEHTATLILDPKSYGFRDSFLPGDPDRAYAPSLTENIEELCFKSHYQCGGGYEHGDNHVFILHCSPNAVEKPISQYDWGASSLYGGEKVFSATTDNANHRAGGIFLAPSHRDNLKRLLLMGLEYAAESQQNKKPDPNPSLPMLCSRCGCLMSLISKDAMMYGSGYRYRFRCPSVNCTNQVYVTYCSRCRNRLYRHDTRWMYHNTTPGSLYYVRCPNCDAY